MVVAAPGPVVVVGRVVDVTGGPVVVGDGRVEVVVVAGIVVMVVVVEDVVVVVVDRPGMNTGPLSVFTTTPWLAGGLK